MTVRFFYGPNSMNADQLMEVIDRDVSHSIQVDQIFYDSPAEALDGNCGPDQPGNIDAATLLKKAKLYRITIELAEDIQ